MEDAVNSVLCGTSIKDAAAAYGVSKNALKQVFRLSNKSLRFLPLFFTKFLYYIGSSARTRQGAVRRRKFEDQRRRCCDSGRDRRRRDWPTVWKPFDAERKQRSAARSNACSWTFQQTISWCQDIFAHCMIFHCLDLQGFLLNWFFHVCCRFSRMNLKTRWLLIVAATKARYNLTNSFVLDFDPSAFSWPTVDGSPQKSSQSLAAKLPWKTGRMLFELTTYL